MSTDKQDQLKNDISIESISFQRDIWFINLDEHINAYSNLAGQVIKEGLDIHKFTWAKVLVDSKNKSEKHDKIQIENDKDRLSSLLTPDDRKLLQEYGDAISRIDAVKTYSRQMIVLAASYLENVITDFLKCLFYQHPRRMYDFLEGYENQRGKIDLKDILDVKTKEQLLYSLAVRASKNAMRGEIKGVVKRIVKLTDGNFSSAKTDKLVEITEKRNKIVHELSSMFIDPNEVIDVFEFLQELITHLDEISIKLGIPVDKRYSDEGL